jgi:hypothetical protein
LFSHFTTNARTRPNNPYTFGILNKLIRQKVQPTTTGLLFTLEAHWQMLTMLLSLVPRCRGMKLLASIDRRVKDCSPSRENYPCKRQRRLPQRDGEIRQKKAYSDQRTAIKHITIAGLLWSYRLVLPAGTMPEIRNASHGRSCSVVFVDVLSWSLKRHFAPLLFKMFVELSRTDSDSFTQND